MIELTTDAYEWVAPYGVDVVWSTVAICAVAVVLAFLYYALERGSSNAPAAILGMFSIVAVAISVATVLTYFTSGSEFDVEVLREDLATVGFEHVDMVTDTNGVASVDRFKGQLKGTWVECRMIDIESEQQFEVFCTPL